MYKVISGMLGLLLLSACSTTSNRLIMEPELAGTKIAFLADIHFHDVYGKLTDSEHQGLPTATAKGKQHALVRSMKAQLHSTRLFNENYFVFLKTLEDLAKRDIKLVALPGDFSDDGQPMHIHGLVEILNYYQQNHGMRFFAIPGNHDPVRPFTLEAGKPDFLGEKGQELAIFSRNHPLCKTRQQENLVCSDGLKKWGYREIMSTLANFGFYPQADYLYFETPFSQKNGGKFDFANRQLRWCLNPEEPQDCIDMPDASYLVEPVKGLWLLAIDANVYVPKDVTDMRQEGDAFEKSSNAGYNAMLHYKPEVISWIKDVAVRARQQNKQLIAFSHFPMADFDETAGAEIRSLFGNSKLQMRRMPEMHTAKALANTGLTLHVGGHMHINDTGIVKSDSGQTLFNIQAPTLAAYRPGYKLFTIDSADIVDVETVILNDVPRFKELFPHYHREHAFLSKNAELQAWDKTVLEVQDYEAFTDKHLTELIRLRYLPREWPVPLAELLQAHTAWSLHQYLLENPCQEDSSARLSSTVKHQEKVDMQGLTGIKIINDFYRLRSADSIALLSGKRKHLYRLMHQTFDNVQSCSTHPEIEQVKQLFSIINKFVKSEPSENFRLDLHLGTLQAH